MDSQSPAYKFEAQVVSLKRSTERRAAFERDLGNTRLSWHFFDALSGDDNCGVDYNDAGAVRYFGRPMTKGEVGCFKSHYKLLSDFVARSDLDWLLVLEDDVIVDENFDFDGLIDHIVANRIDGIRLYFREFKPSRHMGWFRHYQILKIKTDPRGTQAYLVNKTAARKMLAPIKAIVRPIDDEFGRFWENRLPIFSVFPFPIIEKNMLSTINAGREELDTRKNNLPGVTAKLDRYFVRLRDKYSKMLHSLFL